MRSGCNLLFSFFPPLCDCISIRVCSRLFDYVV